MNPLTEPLQPGKSFLEIEGDDFELKQRIVHDGRQLEIIGVIPPSDRPRKVRLAIGLSRPDADPLIVVPLTPHSPPDVVMAAVASSMQRAAAEMAEASQAMVKAANTPITVLVAESQVNP